MRLIAWNCSERFARNYAHLHDLDFDVAIVSECGPFQPGPGESRAVTSVMSKPVDLPGHSKHIGVLARDPWRVEALPPIPGQPWLLPVSVSGPVEFTVLAVWAQTPGWIEGRPSYATQTARSVGGALTSMDGPTVLAGDLNAPIASNPVDARRHDDTVSRLAALGLVSAFTAARGEVDPLTEPTYYHQRRAEQPFHIHHIFVPTSWAAGLQVTVGTFREWVESGRSDHVPVVADVRQPVPHTPNGAAAHRGT